VELQAKGGNERGQRLLVRPANMRPRARFERTPLSVRDFPPRLGRFVYVPSPDGLETNLLILFHGLGDSPDNFVQFGQRMELPQCSLLAITAPHAVSCDLGHAWFPAFEDDGTLIAEPLPPGDARRTDGLAVSREACSTLLSTLGRCCNWQRSEIFLLGFDQGGTVAIDLATRVVGPRIGGAVGISCLWLLPEEEPSSQASLRSGIDLPPLLSLHGTEDPVLSLAAVRESHRTFLKKVAPRAVECERGSAETAGATVAGDSISTSTLLTSVFLSDDDATHGMDLIELKGGGHSTPRTAAHARPLLAFLAKWMARRSIALENDAADVYELRV